MSIVNPASSPTTAATPSVDPTISAILGALGKSSEKGTKTLTTSMLDLIRHPGLNTGFGLALSALAAFTSAIPASDRTASVIMGGIYSALVQIIDKF